MSAASLPFDSARRYLPIAKWTPFSDTTSMQYELGSVGMAKCTFYLSTTATLRTCLLRNSPRNSSKEIRIDVPPRLRWSISLVWVVHMWWRMERRQRRRQAFVEESWSVRMYGQNKHSTCARWHSSVMRSCLPHMLSSSCNFSFTYTGEAFWVK